MNKNILVFAAIIAAPLLSTAAAATDQAAKCGEFGVNAGGVANRKVVSKALEARIAAFGRDTKVLPGMAVAVIKDGDIVLLRGYGYADLETCAPVATDTRFYLKSTTKSFLGVLAAILQEEGAVKLDAPITEYLPDLQLSPPLNAAQISLRAHFTHTIPYADGGLNYATAAFGSIPEARYVEHVNKFATAKPIEFDYSNFGPIMGAHALGAATGDNWRNLLESRVFAPAGMTSTFAYVAKAEKGPLAVAYLAPAPGEFLKTYTKAEAQMHAAGGVYSTIEDMARWTQVELGDGALEDKSIFPKRAMIQSQSRQVQLNWRFYEFERFAAGLGIYDADYEGDVLSHHFGGETHFSFMPEKGIGIVVLTNAIGDGVAVSHRLAATIYDELLAKPDMSSRWARRLGEIENYHDETRREYDARVAATKAKAPMGPATLTPAAIAGLYRSDRLGDAVVTAEGGALSIRIGVKDGAPQWVSGDAYLVDAGLWGDPPSLWVFRRDAASGRLVIDWDGRIFTRDAP